jgi:cephalosporin hydroxylase
MKKFFIKKFHQFYYNSKVWKDTYWLGHQVMKCPLDLWIYQEMIFELKPDIIVECGTARGGSALYLANVCQLVNHGQIITIDIKQNENLPQHERIKYLIGSSISKEIFESVKSLVRDKAKVMVILDSDHSRDHVIKEMNLYKDLVTDGSYMIIEDSNINGNPVKKKFGPGPMEAIDDFLKNNTDFIIDKTKEKFFLTFNPRGILKKSKNVNI